MTERQKRFVDFYIQTANASEAARLAGYSKRNANRIGAENLSKLDIAAAIKERLKTMEDERIIETEKILEHLSDVIRGKVEETLVTPSGKKFIVPVRENDRLRAAEMILKIRGLFRDKVDMKVGGAELFIQTLEKISTNIENGGVS